MQNRIPSVYVLIKLRVIHVPLIYSGGESSLFNISFYSRRLSIKVNGKLKRIVGQCEL